MNRSLFYVLSVTAALLGCNPSGGAAPPLPIATAPSKAAIAPTFDGQRAYTQLKELCALGNRYYGAPKRPEVINQLEQALKDLGATTRRQTLSALEPISGAQYELTNIIGQWNPTAARRIILGTHWDTRLWAEEDADNTRQQSPIVGANDGTSGVVVLLELMRLAHENPALIQNIGVDVVFFDGEEFGRPRSNNYCKGSQHFQKVIKEVYPQSLPFAAIVLDMVGDKDLVFRRERLSQQQAGWLNDLLWQTGEAVNASAFDADDMIGPIIDDHHPLQQVGIPAILLIDYDYDPWHTHLDTPDQCTPESLAITGTTLLRLLENLNGTPR
jgi:glutaminyl-peptide cyclotransferase